MKTLILFFIICILSTIGLFAALSMKTPLVRFTPRVPMQKIQHTKYTLDNNVKIGNDRLKATFGLQQNQVVNGMKPNI